jgi:hypothetical protein
MTDRRKGGHARRVGTRAIGIVLGLLAGALGAYPPAAADDLAAQRAAVHQLVGSQLPSGLLDFDMDFLAGKGLGSGKTVGEKSAFIARQSGTAYGIAKYLEQTKDARVLAPLIKLIQTLGELSLPVGKTLPQRAVESTGALSLPFLRITVKNTLDGLGLLYASSGDGALVAYEQGYATAWAGTAALALLAELHYFRATGDTRFAPLRERWRNGLGVLRVPGAGFREYPGVIDEGAYANGEAWLAFAVYVDTFPHGSISAEEMRQIDDHMIATYGNASYSAFFHWGSMAASQRFRTTKDRRFVDFLETQARTALDGGPAADIPMNTCAFVEGLAASAGTLARGGRVDGELYRKLRARVRAEMDKNNALQLRSGQDRIVFGNDGYFFAPRLRDYAGAYLIGRTLLNVRIDMTHHCISAVTEMQSG